MSYLFGGHPIIVIGGGHAGIEAAFASAKMGINVFLFVLDQKFIFVIIGSKCDFFFSCSLTLRGK